MTQPQPPLEFLSVCSPHALANFELSRLNLAANLNKELRALVDELVRNHAEALLAAWMRTHRAALMQMLASSGDMEPLQKTLDFMGVSSIDGAPAAGLKSHANRHPSQCGELPVG
jgi:hypothetical protein